MTSETSIGYPKEQDIPYISFLKGWQLLTIAMVTLEFDVLGLALIPGVFQLPSELYCYIVMAPPWQLLYPVIPWNPDFLNRRSHSENRHLSILIFHVENVYNFLFSLFPCYSYTHLFVDFFIEQIFIDHQLGIY